MNGVTIMTDKIRNEVCDRLSEGESLVSICKDEHLPSRRTIIRHLASDPAFLVQYNIARAEQADFLAEQIIQISDDGENDTYIDEDGNKRVDVDCVNRSRMRIDARKWYAGKLSPKKYGDKITQEISGADGGAIQHGITVSFVSTKKRDD
jgi:hypothetical protein